jgi:hypothetical protein
MLYERQINRMLEQQLYDRAIKILDNFHEESESIIKGIVYRQDWLGNKIYHLFKQGSNITFALLSNSEKSKFQNERYVTELIYIGALGRIIRDIYVNIIYLKTNKFSVKDMKLCWDFQILCQKINAIKYTVTENDLTELDSLEVQKRELELEIAKINFSTKGELLNGKAEKMLSLKELAEIKGFNKDKFHNEFVYFSQFVHSTAFANSFLTEQGIDFRLVAATYHKIVAYFVGIVTESIELLCPNYPQLDELTKTYKEIIDKRWNTSTMPIV